MKVLTPEDEIVFNKKSVFLAGTTPKKRKNDWRKQVIKMMEQSGFDGVVYNPDYTELKTRLSYEDQIMWEVNAMKSSAVVAFWVDRDMPKRPGLTTNVEFGYWLKNNKIVYGRPDKSEKCFYLDYVYLLEQNKTPNTNIINFVEDILDNFDND